MQSAATEQDVQSLGAFMLFIITSGISISYYVTFKTYHASLNTMESLKAMLVNPNARVAAGDQGKAILKRISDNKKKVENPKKIAKVSTKSNETATLLKQLIAARQADTYQVPLLEAAAPKKVAAKKVVKASKED